MWGQRSGTKALTLSDRVVLVVFWRLGIMTFLVLFGVRMWWHDGVRGMEAKQITVCVHGD